MPIITPPTGCVASQPPLAAEERITDILRRLNMVSSGAEARRLIQQNGVRLDGEPVTDVMAST